MARPSREAGIAMWDSYKRDAEAMRLIMAAPGWKPKLPMTRWQKVKAKIYGRLQKLLQRMD